MLIFFFFQAEDGIRDRTVTGVQTCALPIYEGVRRAGNVGDPLPDHPARARLGDTQSVTPLAQRAEQHGGEIGIVFSVAVLTNRGLETLHNAGEPRLRVLGLELPRSEER